MIEAIETLMALKRHRTMSKAGQALRLTQSTVSKRISALESEMGVNLVERVGRYVHLTQEAEQLIEKAQPLLGQLKDFLKPGTFKNQQPWQLGVSESILASWGSRLLLKSFQSLETTPNLFTHRSPLVLEKVAAGELDIGLIAGEVRNRRGLILDTIGKEEMVFLTGKRNQSRSDSKTRLLCIEKNSATYTAVRATLANYKDRDISYLQSFASIVQLTLNGYGDSISPIGMVTALNPYNKKHRSLRPKVYRPIYIVYRKSKLQDSNLEKWIQCLRRDFKNQHL